MSARWSLLWSSLLIASACAPRARDGLPASGLSPLPAIPAGAPDADGAATATGQAEEAERPVIVAEPETLRVYRATPVELTASPPASVAPDAFSRASCRWSFGDATPEREGCAISHTFLRGTADERVTLTVELDGTRHSVTRILPLERLSVSPEALGEAPTDGTLPPPPDGPTSFRLVLLSETAGVTGQANLAATLAALSPALVVHLGGVVARAGAAAATTPEGAWETIRDRLAEPLARAGVPLVWALSPEDLGSGPVVRHPASAEGALELAAGSRFPSRSAMTFRGVHLTVLTGDVQDDETLAWLRARLDEAQVYEARIVLSHLPLHPFSGRVGPTLGPRFKLYELFLRARVSLLATAAHGVHYAARYGALPVVSVGRIDGSPSALAGQALVQPPSLTLVDVEEGRLARVHALEQTPDGRWLPLDPAYLPDRVEVYTR